MKHFDNDKSNYGLIKRHFFRYNSINGSIYYYNIIDIYKNGFMINNNFYGIILTTEIEL